MEKSKSCSVAGICGVATVGLFCPLCIPAIAVFLSSLGLGFLATKEAVWTLLVIVSIMLFLGLLWGYRSHRNLFPLIVGILGIAAIPLGNYVVMSRILTYAGVVAVIIAGTSNLLLKHKANNTCCPPKQEH